MGERAESAVVAVAFVVRRDQLVRKILAEFRCHHVAERLPSAGLVREVAEH